jgi:hypothetical protein
MPFAQAPSAVPSGWRCVLKEGGAGISSGHEIGAPFWDAA